MGGTQFHTSFSSAVLFPLQHILCVPSANWLCRFFRIAVLCSWNHVICHPEEPSLREREELHPPTHTWYLSLQHDFSMSKMCLLTVSNQQPQTSSENWDCKKVRRLGGTHSKLEAIISTWCSSILSILGKKKVQKNFCNK